MAEGEIKRSERTEAAGRSRRSLPIQALQLPPANAMRRGDAIWINNNPDGIAKTIKDMAAETDSLLKQANLYSAA